MAPSSNPLTGLMASLKDPLLNVAGAYFPEMRPVLDILKGPRRSRRSIPKKTQAEAVVANALAAKMRGSQREVVVPGGRIDILTPTEVIEVKIASRYRAAIGQVLDYGQYYPHHRLRIHLFGQTTPDQRRAIRKLCQTYKIKVTFESP
ncbi:MAG: hypothetical protein IGQ88_07865 [Gloeomargaritaceae cyanobacterium C42_A2020_066]|nr:hypothetical protein [Gloeomargaritaceae cyanobacterium C42_A2020_066]